MFRKLFRQLSSGDDWCNRTENPCNRGIVTTFLLRLEHELDFELVWHALRIRSSEIVSRDLAALFETEGGDGGN
jgi:hypothetical protein